MEKRLCGDIFPDKKYVKQEVLKKETQSSKTFNCLIKNKCSKEEKLEK